ncbi:cytochrome c oxidase accessory protein FixG [Catalinimonas alkaloidigena]|uniref:Cytochrome c oxidase accessory protein FixG n=1 Tax=Catalinimonas alkaloidigena TaxID=1075417 RepID=A0A1G8WC27_9BACT|nr:cytochrome c oxidase accessory protein CcoG [Catalinimonas alkaloidigena]SDJ75782.1 cytochrome c oxidase accessory protein FixG [Catalinimonas alkaloidigena]
MKPDHEQYRDSIATVDATGKRVWVYPKKPQGRLHNYRRVFSVLLLALFFAGPFITIGGQPLLLLNLFERRFVLLGQVFWPQDFYLFGLAMIIFVLFVIVFTVAYGRLFCGWACPQTVFMEMVFRKIEYLIEGDANQQRKLQAAPWTTEKLLKKGSKHFLFFLIALLFTHTVMAYLIGIEQVSAIVSSPPSAHWAGFTGLVFFTGAFYGTFAFMREQVCIAVCPYGRLQGVLLGRESIVVAYDWLRGEPRGKIRKQPPSTFAEKVVGDCVDCSLCVQVCPTGIDIRNGTQLECVNCTACIDACDGVMEKVGRPKGLIRYDSLQGIEERRHSVFTPRILGYSAVLVVLLGLFSYLLFSRTDVATTVLRVPGMLYQEQPHNRISNLYNIQFVNKTFEPMALDVRLKAPEGGSLRRVGDEALTLPPGEMVEGVYFIELPRSDLQARKTKITLQIFRQDELIDEIETSFMGPAK